MYSISTIRYSVTTRSRALIFPSNCDQPRHRGSFRQSSAAFLGPLLTRQTRKALALLVLLATAVSPVQASPDPSVCDRTEQVRDAIVAMVPVSDCADVTDVHLADIRNKALDLLRSSIVTLQEGDFAGLTNIRRLYLRGNRGLTALPEGIFADLGGLRHLQLHNNSLTALPEGIFSGTLGLRSLRLDGNNLADLPGGIFSGLTALETLELEGNPGINSGGVFRPIADAGADQFAEAGQVVTLMATVSEDDPWGDNVSYDWRRTDHSGVTLNLMDATTASPSFVMPAGAVWGATVLEFRLTVTGRGGDDGDGDVNTNPFVDRDIVRVRHPVVVTLTGPKPAATTLIRSTGVSYIVEDSISLVYTYSATDLKGRVLADNIEVTAAVDGVAVTPTINIDEASGQGEITVVLRRQEYPARPIGHLGHLLAVTLRLSASAAAEGFFLGEPSSITTPFSFVVQLPADPSVCDRTPQVRDAIVALVPVSDCADVTNVHLFAAVDHTLDLSESSIVTLQEGDFAGLANLLILYLYGNSLTALPEGIFADLTRILTLYLQNNNLRELSADVFSGLPRLVYVNLSNNSLTALPGGVFSGLTNLEQIILSSNSLEALPAGVFSGLSALASLALYNNSLTALPRGVFSDFPLLGLLGLAGNPGSEGGFRPIANAGADQTAGVGQVVTLTATASDDDPWGNKVRYYWTRTDNSGGDLTLMDAETASPSFVMPAGATELEFELRVLGAGVDYALGSNGGSYYFVGTDSLKVRRSAIVGPAVWPTAVWPTPGAGWPWPPAPDPNEATTNIVHDSISLLYTYSTIDLEGRVLAGKIEVTAAVDGVAVTPSININGAVNVILIVLEREAYPRGDHLLKVELRLSAAASAEGLVLGEPSSITTPFSFFSSVDPSVCDRTPQVRDAIVALVPVSDCADVTHIHLAGIGVLDLSRSSIVTLQEGDFAGLANLYNLALNDNNLMALPGGVFSGLTALDLLNLDGNPGSEGFRPIADAGADQTAGVGQVVTLTATVSEDDPWGDNVRYVWTRTDNSGSDLTLMDTRTASPSFVMPMSPTGLEFTLRVIGRGIGDIDAVNHFVGTDSLKVRHPDAVVTLTGPEPAAPTTEIVENEFSLVFTYSAADLYGRVLAGNIEVAAAVDGVALTPTINIDEARGQGEITVVLRRQEYPGPIGRLLAVALSLSAAAEGLVLGEPSSITTTFSFFSSVDPSVCARTEQVRDAIVALVPVSHCADITDVHLAGIGALNLSRISIVALQEGDFAGLTNLSQLLLNNNSLEALPAGVFSGLTALLFLNLNDNSLEALPAGVFSGLPALRFLYLDGNPGSEGFRPIADAGADQTAGAAQVVTLTATVSDDDPWGDNVHYVWTRTDNSGSDLTLMDAETASPSFVMPAGATGLEFELRVTGRGGDHFVGTDSLKVRHPDAVVTLAGPEPAATTTNVVEDSINLVYTYTYSAADLHGRVLVLAGNIEVAAAVDGVAVTPDINIDEARGQGEITVVLRRQEYPGPIGHLLAVTLRLGAGAEGFVLGEPSSMTTNFSFFSSVDPSVCARTEQVRDAILASVPVSHCADVTDVHLADIGALNLSRRSIVALQEGDFAGLTNLFQILLNNNSLAALPAGIFSGLPALLFLNLNDNSLEALPAGVFSGLPALRFLYLDGNPGSEGFRPIADAGADQTAGAAQVVTLTATASGDDPWGDNVHYVWTRIDNSGSELTLMDAETASPSFVMPAGATGLEFELRVTGRGGDPFVGADSLKVRHPDAVVTLTGPEPAATTTNVVEDSINLVYTYSAADLHGRILAGNIEVTAAVDGVAITPDINIDEASGQGEVTVVLRRQEYPGPIERLLAVTLSLSAGAAAEGFVLGEPSSITTPFRFVLPADPSVCARTPQVRDAIAYYWGGIHCADVTDGHLADQDSLSLSWSSIVTLQEGDFAGFTNLRALHLDNNSLEALPAGIFSGLPNLKSLYLQDNSLTLTSLLLAGVFSGLPALTELYLNGNNLMELSADAFSGLPALKALYLHGNNLMELSAGAFSGLPLLVRLTLGNNGLTALSGGVFAGLTDLEHLYLNDNNLMELSADVFSGLLSLGTLNLEDNSLTALPGDVFSGLPALTSLYLNGNNLMELSADVISGLPSLEVLHLGDNNLMELSADIFSGLPLKFLYLNGNNLTALPGGVFAGLTDLERLYLSRNNLMELSADVFSGLSRLWLLDLYANSLTALPGGVFSGLPRLWILYLGGNPGSEGFRPIANAGADQTARDGQVVTLTATVSAADPWGDNVHYVWTWTDNSSSSLTLMDADTASPSFVMPAGATGLEFKLKVTGRGVNAGDPLTSGFFYVNRTGDPNYFFDTDTLKVRHPDSNAVVVTLTGPEPAATTTNIVEDSINLVYTYSAADLHGRVLAGKLEVTAAVDGVAITPDINIDEASGQGEITVVLRRQEYPGPIGHLLAVTLSLSASAAAEGFVLGEPSSITTPFSFFSSVDSSVCARTEQVRDALVASVPVSHCADVTDVHLADIGALDLSWSSIVTLQEGDFAGLLALVFFDLSNNSLEALPAGVFSGLPALVLLDLSNNSLEALPAGVFSELPTLSLLYLDGNPGSEGFRPIADAGADQTAAAAQVVTLTATASGDDPWGDNVRYVWTRTDNSGSDLTLMDAETASPSFVMPAGATGLEFELRVTGRGGAHFVGTDSLKVRHPDPNAVVVTLTGPEPAATTTNVVEDSINLVYTYSVAGLHGRVLVLAGNIEVTAAVDGVAVTPTIKIDEASGHGEITVVLRRQEYPGPIGHVLAVTLSLSAGAAAEGFVLGEPSSITTPFSFRAVDGP